MKKIAAIELILLLSIILFAGSDIFDFVHKDYDFVIRISNGRAWYDELKKVTFFSFILDRKGLGFEDSFQRMLEDMRYKTGILPTVVQDALSNDILFASKGIDIDVASFISFDINYYLEFIKTLTTNSFFVFESKYFLQFVKALAFLLSVDYKALSNNVYQLGDTLFSTSVGKYVLIAGSKQTLDLAIKTFSTPDMQLSKSDKDFDRLKAGTFFISGYAKPNTLKFTLPGGVGINDADSNHLLITSNISAGVFSFTIEQKNTKQYTSQKNTDNLGLLAKSWNYYVCIPAARTESVVNFVEQWFSGITSDIQKLTNLVKGFLVSSKSTYITGRLESGEVVFIFDNYSGKDLETNLSKLGVQYDSQKQEFIMNLQNAKLYAFMSSNRLVFGTINKSKFEQYERTNKKLKELPLYYDLSKIVSYDLKAFIDIGDIIRSTTGFNITSKLLFWQYSIGYLTYYKFSIS
ncbi:MAG: hypothetical protein ACP5KD_07765 [Fervidobacterium sp.]